jgi:hypothetical protein
MSRILLLLSLTLVSQYILARDDFRNAPPAPSGPRAQGVPSPTDAPPMNSPIDQLPSYSQCENLLRYAANIAQLKQNWWYEYCLEKYGARILPKLFNDAPAK